MACSGYGQEPKANERARCHVEPPVTVTPEAFYGNRQSGFVILVVVPKESWLRDFVTAPALIPLFSRPWSLLQLELAQFQIAFRFCRDHLALPAPVFVSYSAFVLAMVKYPLGRKGLE